MNRIYVLGMGPGHPDYVLPLTRRLIEESDLLVGGERHLTPYATSGKSCHPLRGDMSVLMDTLRAEREQHQIAVLLSGDPGFYGMLALLRRHFPAEDLYIVPGISAFQYLMAHLGEPWHPAALASLHGRDCDFMAAINTRRHSVLLTDNQHSAHWLAAQLAHLEHITLTVGSHLSYADERIVSGTPAQILAQPPFELATVVVTNDKF